MIVITAPTGLIGRQVRNVLDSGEPVRVIVRDPSVFPEQVRSGRDRAGSHGDIGSSTGRSRCRRRVLLFPDPTQAALRPRRWNSPDGSDVL
jgi:hypothetical protein